MTGTSHFVLVDPIGERVQGMAVNELIEDCIGWVVWIFERIPPTREFAILSGIMTTVAAYRFLDVKTYPGAPRQTIIDG